MNLIFYHYLDTLHILFLSFSLDPSQEIYYFDISKPAQVLLRLLRLEKRIKYFKFSLADVKNAQGESYYPKIFGEDLIYLCNSIENETLRKNVFIASVCKMFNSHKPINYLAKLVEEKLRSIVIFLNVIQWHREQRHVGMGTKVAFHIFLSPYSEILANFARRRFDIQIISSLSFKLVYDTFYYYGCTGYLLLSSFFSPFKFRNVTKLFISGTKPNTTISRISLAYVGLGITFDLTERCEFPWLLTSRIPNDHLLICFRRKDLTVTDDILAQLRSRGISYVTLEKSRLMSKGMPVHHPRFLLSRSLTYWMFRLVYVLFSGLIRRGGSSLLFTGEMIRFIIYYAKAEEFYSFYNVKIHIDRQDYIPHRIAEHLALEKYGGVSISYQISNWPIPSVGLGSTTDIMFVMGPYYKEVLIKSSTDNSKLVYYGYFNDYAFAQVKNKSMRLRNRLLSSGARFIICYFDENSSDDRMSIIPNRKSAFVYEKLLTWVLSDETLGLICCPKKPNNLLQRIPQVKLILQSAEATGRCIVMTGDYLTRCYPTEPAQASDIVIALLIGGTVGMESLLSGTRTAYLDLEGFYSYAEYRYGKDTLVFDSMDNLIHAIMEYREKTDVSSAFGNINALPMISQKDHFRDGRAAERMGSYVDWLSDQFEAGKKREESLRYADNQYSTIWGSENIESLNHHHQSL